MYVTKEPVMKVNGELKIVESMNKVIDTPHVSVQIATRLHLQDIHRVFGKKIARKFFSKRESDIKFTTLFLEMVHEDMLKGNQTVLFARSNDTGDSVALITLIHPDGVVMPTVWFKEEKDGYTDHAREEIIDTLRSIQKFADQFLQYEYLYFVVSKNDISLKNALRDIGGVQNNYHYVETDNLEAKTDFLVSYTLKRM